MRPLSAQAGVRIWFEGLTFALTVVLALALAATVANAQLSTASVTGVVRDSSGSTVSGARLVLINLDTSVKRELLTNNVGNYAFVSITPGNYSLEAEFLGQAIR